MSRTILTSKEIALVAIFAALQAVLCSLPYTISVGVSGQITLGVIGVPIIGVLLGPFLGGPAVLIGSIIGAFVNPGGAIFGFLSVLPPTLGAIGAGFCMQKKGYIPGAIILASLAVFYAHPFGRESLMYPWLDIIAMITAFVSLAPIAVLSFHSPEIKRFSWGIPIFIFVGTLTDHMFGSALAIWYFNPILTPDIWNFVTFVYPLERIVVVVLATLVTLPLYYSLQRAELLIYSKPLNVGR